MALGWFLGLMGLVSCGGALWYFGQRQRLLRREAFIRNAELPRGLFDALRRRRPKLSLKECQLVANGLRQFFLAHLKSGRRHVSMPSQVAATFTRMRSRVTPSALYIAMMRRARATLASASKLRRASTSVETRPGINARISQPKRTSSRSMVSSSGLLRNLATVSFSRSA